MNKTSFVSPGRLAVLGLALVLSLRVAYAQEDRPPDADPPDRAARLSLIQGEVSLQPAGEDEWASAVVNRPLTTGDKLWTDAGARAEIYVGPAAVRLGSDTGFSFLNVDDDTIQMRMTAGVINVRVRAVDANDQIEIDTPNMALSVLRPGNYRVEVNDEGDTTVVKVSEGEIEATGGSQDVVVHAQQAATFRGIEQVSPPLMASLGAPDEFDSWSLERDRRDQQAATSQTAQYVAPEVTGYEDLDANGTWSSEPEYGYVWTPRVVAVDWSPYRYGRWVWVAPWGWTWVDDAPWGYAPFHYGRWARVRDRWCWVPGPRHVRAVYAPALVGWVGTPGVSVSVTVGGGGVAWFPLGPREVYVPARRFSPRYVERVNVTNTVIVNKTYITNVYENRVTNITYRNRGVPGGVTAVSRTTFTSAERVGGRTVRIDEREITRVRATGVAPSIQPVRESRLGVSEAARRNVRMPPTAVVNRQVIVKRPPPPAAAHFARNAEAATARDQADRLHRIQSRDDANRGSATAPGAAPANAQTGRDRDREDAARAAAARNRGVTDERSAQDERPPQSRVRPDRPPGSRGSAIPDHLNRSPAAADREQQRANLDQARQQRDQAQQAERQQREAQQNAQREQMRQRTDQDRQQRDQAQQAERQQRDAQQNAQREQMRQRADQDRQHRDQAQQAERQQREAQQNAQRDQAQQVERQQRDAQQNAQREQMRLRADQDRQQRDQAQQAERQQREAQMNAQREQAQLAERQQRDAEQRAQRDQMRERANQDRQRDQAAQAERQQAAQAERQQREQAERQQRAQQDAQQREAQRQQQEAQRMAQRQQQAERQRAPENRPQPQGQQERDRRRASQNEREQ